MKQAGKAGIMVLGLVAIVALILYITTGCKREDKKEPEVISSINNEDVEILEEIPLLSDDAEVIDGVQKEDDEISPEVSESITPENTPVPQNGTPVMVSESGEYLNGNLTPVGQIVDNTFTLFGDYGYAEVVKDDDTYRVVVNEADISIMYEMSEFARILRDNYGLDYSEAEYISMIENNTFSNTIEAVTYQADTSAYQEDDAEIEDQQ